MKFRLLVVTLLLLVVWQARAQAGLPAGAAKVYAVKETGNFSEFVVPQVRLPNAAAATRINRALLRQIIGSNADGKINSMSSPRAQLGQAAALACCFSGARYRVLLNQGNLLSLEFTLEFHGAYDYERTDHAVFDLRTGQRLTLTDLLADSPARMRRRLAGAISRRISAFLADTTGYPELQDSATMGDLVANFNWNLTTRRVKFQANTTLGTDEPDLENFALTPHELRLYYGPILPHAIQNFEPDDTYHFPYGRLQPRGLLGPLAKVKATHKQ